VLLTTTKVTRPSTYLARPWSTSKVTTLWCYINQFIIIIIKSSLSNNLQGQVLGQVLHFCAQAQAKARPSTSQALTSLYVSSTSPSPSSCDAGEFTLTLSVTFIAFVTYLLESISNTEPTCHTFVFFVEARKRVLDDIFRIGSVQLFAKHRQEHREVDRTWSFAHHRFQILIGRIFACTVHTQQVGWYLATL